MNKIYNINLGGYPFTIDEDAYHHLNAYLKTIHKHFRDSEGRDEIIADIESRIAELFNESTNGKPIVGMAEVEKVIQIMGTPEEFGAEETIEEIKDKRQYKTGRKIYRDSDDQVIGGVCSGIAAYFGVPDPLWVRLVFVVSFLTGGIGVPLYIILWTIIPEAKTAADRLSMKGEPINVSSIAKTIQDEVDNLSDTITEIGRGISSKKKAKKKKVKQDAPLERGLLY